MTMIDSGTQATPAEIKQSVAELEDEAITIIREVAAECRNPVLLFSGGKDSAVLLHLVAKAFRPGSLPFPVMHVDTGHNFEEVITYRDMLVEQYGVKLIVASVQESIDSGRAVEKRVLAQVAIACNQSPCWTQSPSTNLTQLLVADVATKIRPAPKNVF